MQVDTWTGAFLLASIIIAIFTLGFWAGIKVTDPNPISNPTNSIDCKGYDLFSTSYCLQAELREYVEYNLTNKDEFWNTKAPINWDFIKEYGGVCWHYAEYFVNRAKELGFQGKRIDVWNGLNHSIAIIHDNNSYCIADNKDIITCQRLKG